MLLYGSLSCHTTLYTLDQSNDLILARYYPVSKKLNHKDKVNNFVALPGESVSSFWHRFTTFVIGVPNYRINDAH